jgi:hypothetical protein
MDNFEELADTAEYTDPLICVTKYHSGLKPRINIVITTSGTTPALTDYLAWCEDVFRQYDMFAHAPRTASSLFGHVARTALGCPSIPTSRLCMTDVLPIPAFTHAPAPSLALALSLPAVVLMDVDQT